MSTARFDHIAYGVDDPIATFATLRGRLGLDWIQWDTNVGFAALQVAFPSGFKIEVIHPFEEERNPFMRRFLDRQGNAPHHLTFRLENIESYLERLEAIGVEPVAVRLDTPAWREAFVHARGGLGILLQLAESDNDKHTDPPESWTSIRPAEPVGFVRLEQLVADTDRAVEILGAIDGTPVGEGVDVVGRFVDVGWGEDRILRLRPDDGHPDGVHRCLVVDRIPAAEGAPLGSDAGTRLVVEELGAVIDTLS